MEDRNYILNLIKESVNATSPGAKVILFGSYARGDYHDDSDIDILVLVDIDKDKLTMQEESSVAFPLFSIGFKTDRLIQPLVYTKKAWAEHRITPFYENVNNEGIEL